ncbi:MAG TPA: DUF4129 domain-containing protein [Candidatus Limnocylindria bacterium]|nr:DUF4129 domain-containing protein [Candidatus Limnocylindria bacterium]
MPLALTDVPVEVGREEAARLAAQELADPAYAVDDPGLVERGIRWVVDRLGELVDRAAGSLPGGRWGLLALVVLGLVVLAFVVWRAGPVRRSSSRETALFVGRAKTSADHRREADRASAQARWEDAVLERFRAIVRALEERTILDPRPGRTADEAAREGGLALPALADDLWAASTTFDAVAYGGRPASSTDDRFLRELDRAVSSSSPRQVAAGTT